MKMGFSHLASKPLNKRDTHTSHIYSQIIILTTLFNPCNAKVSSYQSTSDHYLLAKASFHLHLTYFVMFLASKSEFNCLIPQFFRITIVFNM